MKKIYYTGVIIFNILLLSSCSNLKDKYNPNHYINQIKIDVSDLQIKKIIFQPYLYFKDGTKYDLRNIDANIVNYNITEIKDFQLQPQSLVIAANLKIHNPTKLDINLIDIESKIAIDNHFLAKFNTPNMKINPKTSSTSPIAIDMPINLAIKDLVASKIIKINGNASLQTDFYKTAILDKINFSAQKNIPSDQIYDSLQTNKQKIKEQLQRKLKQKFNNYFN